MRLIRILWKSNIVRIFTTVVLILSLSSRMARATDEPPLRVVKLRWGDLVTLVEDHPSIKAATHRVEAASNGMKASGQVPNPELMTSFAYAEARDSDNTAMEWSLSLSIPFHWTVSRGAAIRSGEAHLAITEAERNALRCSILLSLGDLFWQLVYEQERLLALKALEEQTFALARIVRKRIENGEARPVEETKLDLEREQLAHELDTARWATTASRQKMSLWLNPKTDIELEAIADLTALPTPIDNHQARKLALTSHPNLSIARARTAVSTAELELEKRNRFPSFSVEAFTDHELDRRAYGGGITMDFPVFNWRRHSIRKRENNVAAEKLQYLSDSMEVEFTIIETHASCQSGRQVAQRYKEKILPLARSSAATIQRTYELGEATLLEVVDARRVLLEMQMEYLSTLAQTQTVCHHLSILVGEELP